MKVKAVEFKVVGVTFNNDDGTPRQFLVGRMNTSTLVVLRREPSNIYDMNAVAIDAMIDGRFQQVGYVAKQYAAVMAPMMDAGRKFTALVKEVDRYQNTNYCKVVVSEV